MMLPSRLGCPLSLKTPNMGNPGQHPSVHDVSRADDILGTVYVEQRELVVRGPPVPLEALRGHPRPGGSPEGHPLGEATVVAVQQRSRVGVQRVYLHESRFRHEPTSPFVLPIRSPWLQLAIDAAPGSIRGRTGDGAALPVAG